MFSIFVAHIMSLMIQNASASAPSEAPPQNVATLVDSLFTKSLDQFNETRCDIPRGAHAWAAQNIIEQTLHKELQGMSIAVSGSPGDASPYGRKVEREISAAIGTDHSQPRPISDESLNRIINELHSDDLQGSINPSDGTLNVRLRDTRGQYYEMHLGKNFQCGMVDLYDPGAGGTNLIELNIVCAVDPKNPSSPSLELTFDEHGHVRAELVGNDVMYPVKKNTPFPYQPYTSTLWSPLNAPLCNEGPNLCIKSRDIENVPQHFAAIAGANYSCPDSPLIADILKYGYKPGGPSGDDANGSAAPAS